MTRYGFRHALGAFFLADTAALRPRLPPELFPIEVHPGRAVLAVTAFDFVESEVGPYGELVISVAVPPFAPRGTSLPDAAFFPIALATTSEASRRHAAERWHLPEHPEVVDLTFSTTDREASVVVADVLRLRVGRTRAAPSSRTYQAFSRRDGRTWRVPIRIDGPLDEHEEELGEIELGDSPFLAGLAGAIEDPRPFREQHMGAGEQRFDELVPHGVEA